VTLDPSGVLFGNPPDSAAGTYQWILTASNGAQPNAIQNFTLTVNPRPVPTVTNPFYDTVTSSSAHLGGNVASDNGFPITRRGVVYAPTSVNSNPTLGGTGVLVNDDPLLTTGNFSRTVTGLNSSTNYSFAAFASNSRGVAYSSVVTFQTLPPPGAGSLVVTTLSDEENGTSDPGAGAGTSLREAIAYANALGGNQTITFLPNLYASGPATITATLGIINLANLSGITTIAGPGASQLTISGNNTTRIFQMNEGSARLNGLTLANGNTSSDGAAVRSYGTFYANDCVFTNNASGSQGGAIYNGGAGYIARCTFTNNSATNAGGAIANEGPLWTMNCTFSGNSANSGGAICNIYSSSTARLICSTLTSNSATFAGGGVFRANGNVIANNSIISGNTAPADANVSGTLNAFGLESDLIDADPAAIFTTGTLANNGGPTPTVALKPDGLAVNAGTNSLAVDNTSALLTTDQRAKPRVISSTVDIGAYEVPSLPALGLSTVTDVGITTATLGGNVINDGLGTIWRRGVVYARTSQNPNPIIGGPGVMEADVPGTTGGFSIPVSTLSAFTDYSFTSFASNETGTVYAPVQTFQTEPTPLTFSSALSRLIHGSAGTFDVPLPGVECRASESYSIVASFSNNIVSGNASVISGNGSVSSTSFSGNTMTVNLTGVTTGQTITVALGNVKDEFSQIVPSAPIDMSVLIGDVNGNGAVNASDVSQVKFQSGQPASESNFRMDFNLSGSLNATDASIAKSHSGEGLQ
jgi:dockerin type I repeat protein/polymorphic membrane protein